jgi:hypothetical protein
MLVNHSVNLRSLQRNSTQNHSFDIAPIVLLPRVTIDTFCSLLTPFRARNLVRLLDAMHLCELRQLSSVLRHVDASPVHGGSQMLAHALARDGGVDAAVGLDRQLDCDQAGGFVRQPEDLVGFADVVVGG